MAFFMTESKELEITLEEIKSATDNFNDKKVIGSGGFGKVYAGELSHSKGRGMVAFKRLDRKYGQGDPEFFREIRMLSCYMHENVISLLGFCNQDDEMILVYEYAARGSLDRILNDTALTWTQRIKICLDAAKGLSFLHEANGTHQRVLHCDIKSANILLDENFNAKVSDFGLSKISPANQLHTFLVTNTVGTVGYCDPLYMDTYSLTKESDVYSFGVVLFEVLCGRLCFENINDKFKVFVSAWKKSYEDNNLDGIIFQGLKQQMDVDSLKTFADVAYQCLQKSRNERPSMSHVVMRLEVALELQELHNLGLQDKYKAILKVADHHMKYTSVKELKVLLSKGFLMNEGKRMFSVNNYGQHCESIYIEGCLNPNDIKTGRLSYLLDSNSRFLGPLGGICYEYQKKFKAHVKAQFLSPLVTYTVNLIFKCDNWYKHRYITIRYKLDGETKISIVYDTDKREDGWYMAELYQCTSQHGIVDLEIMFERCWPKLLVAGIDFQPFAEKVEYDQVLKYQDILKAASHSLVYRSVEKLKVLLSKGVHLNGYKTWFSLSENGENCEMVSIADCLTPNDPHKDHTIQFASHHMSRFATGLYQTDRKGFRTHVKTQFLSPLISYTVNLLFQYGDCYEREHRYVGLKYKLEGETKTSTVYLANPREDGLVMAELYQFTSDGRIVDLEIVFDDHDDDLEVEGILFQPMEKVEHYQVLEDDNLQWTLKKDIYSNLLDCFHVGIGQEWFSAHKNGKKCQMISARAVIRNPLPTFQSLPESRCMEELVITGGYEFQILSKIKSHAVSPQTLYATYLVYKLPEDQSPFEAPLYVRDINKPDPDFWYIYLVSPPPTPFIKRMLVQDTHAPLYKPKLDAFPQQRSDGWMEVQVWEFQTLTTIETISMCLQLEQPRRENLCGLIIKGIKLIPI